MNLPEGNHNESDVELNITPIIDCFTVLITFLLASASFISIGYFEAHTPGPGDSANVSRPDVDAIIRIGRSGTAELKWTGKQSGSRKLHDINDESLRVISEELKKIKEQKLTIHQVMITAENDTPYSNLASIMSAVDQSGIPAVIGDFGD